MKFLVSLIAPAASLFAVQPSYAEPGHRVPKPAALDIEMFYQYSATDDDAEVTIGIESPDNPVDALLIVTPSGRAVAVVRSGDDIGLAEIELESAEPSVQEVQQAYPEGVYWFWGRAADGAALVRPSRAHARRGWSTGFRELQPVR